MSKVLRLWLLFFCLAAGLHAEDSDNMQEQLNSVQQFTAAQLKTNESLQRELESYEALSREPVRDKISQDDIREKRLHLEQIKVDLDNLNGRTNFIDKSLMEEMKRLDSLQTLLQSLPLTQEQKLDLAGSLGRARVHTLRQAEQVLRGPTGEHNVLGWQAPKRVWLYGGDLARSFAALAQLAASGVQTVVEGTHPLAQYAAEFPMLIAVSDAPATAGISHVAALDTLPAERKEALAKTDGALIRIIPSPKGLDILQVFEEVSCSINTTAAGGNASLMAMAEV